MVTPSAGSEVLVPFPFSDPFPLELKHSTTDKDIPFLLVSSTDHINGVTVLTPAAEISKYCGVFAASVH